MLSSNTAKGMVWDTHSNYTGDQVYSFVFNGSLHSHSSEQSYPFISNNTSNIECVNFIKGYQVIGIVAIKELGASIIALYNEETLNKIFLKVDYTKKDLGKGDQIKKIPGNCIKIVENKGEETVCQYSELLNTSCFQWDHNHPVRFEYKITDTTLNLYFINGLDQDRFINFNLDDFSLDKDFKIKFNPDDCDVEYIDHLDCDKTLWYPLIDPIRVKLEKISGGRKLPGKYNYLFAYSTSKGVPLTPFTGLGQGFSLFERGKDSTDFGIKLTIEGIKKDTRHRYYTIVVVESRLGNNLYKQIGTYPVSQTTVFDWDNEGSPIGLPILMSQYPFYKNSSSITESNNILFKAGLSEFEKFNLQSIIARDVKVEWVDTVLKEGDYKLTNDYVSNSRDEVYAFGIEIILQNSEKGPVFMLVGRQANSNDLIIVTDPATGEQVPNWKINNTATLTGSSAGLLSDKYDRVLKGEQVPHRWGEFGYYESTDRYPNVKEVWGDLCSQPIRHFKFPDNSISPHFTSVGPTAPFSELNYIHPLGVRVTTDMEALFDQAVSEGLITPEQRSRIKGWKLVRANRQGNNSIVAKGLFYDMWQYKRENKDENFSLFTATDSVCQRENPEAYFPNYPFNDLRDDPFLTDEYRWYLDKSPKDIQDADPQLLQFVNSGRYTFHSPDTHFTNPDLGTRLKIEGIASGKAQGYFSQAELQAKQRLLNWKHYNLAISLARYIANLQSSPAKEEVQALATNVGNAAGNALGTVASMFGPVGKAVGGVLKAAGGLIGGLVGKNIYENNPWFQFVETSFRNTIVYTEVDKLVNIFTSIINSKQYHYQYQAIGNYNSFTSDIPETIKHRKLTTKEYIDNGKYTIDGDLINNYNRESSVYLKVNEEISTTPLEGLDTSKVIISDNSSFNEIILSSEESVVCSKYSVTALEETSNTVQNAPYFIWGNLCTEPEYITREMAHSSAYYLFTKLENGELKPGDYVYFSNAYEDGYILTDDAYEPFDVYNNLPPFLKFNAKWRARVTMDSNGELRFQKFSEFLGAVQVYSGLEPVFFLGYDNNYIQSNCYAGIDIVPWDPFTLQQVQICAGIVDPFENCIGGWKRAFSDENIALVQMFDYKYDSNIIIEEIAPACGEITQTTYKKETSNCSCNTVRETNIASYYGSLKQDRPNQYGTIFDIEWLNTGSGSNYSGQIIFGGDTYIGRMSLKRKHSFFNQTLFQREDDFEINYSLLGNAANPIYYYDKNPIKLPKNEFELGNLTFPITLNKNNRSFILKLLETRIFRIEDQISIPKFKLDCGTELNSMSSKGKLEFYSADGFMYLYNYGIVSFIAESSTNLDLRDKGDNLSEDFYPSISDLDIWLQEKNVSPALDNFYKYDRSFTKQPHEEFHYMYDINFRGDNDRILRDNRIIYSAQGSDIDDDDYSDPFLVNKALDWKDFSKKYGKIVSIEGIEGDKVIVQQEHLTSVFGAYITLNSDQSTVLISSGSIFNNKPVEFATPNQGYFGSQHAVMLHTPFGHISVDAIRGQVFLLGNGGQNLEEISNKGMYSFFKEYLPFQINRHIPGVNIDNNFNGVGIAMVFDNRFNVFHLTKLDYIPKVNGIRREGNKFLYEDQEVSLNDTRYFCNVSWTISYSFVNQAWYSFQPFTPEFYIEHIDYFDSGIRTGIWRHNITNKSYQKFYGKKFPFIVETLTKYDGIRRTAKNVAYQLDVVQYFNKYDKVHKKNQSFNKAIVSTNDQTSGELILNINENNLFLNSKYPIFTPINSEVLLTIKEDYHSFNQFKNVVFHDNVPLWLKKCDNYFEDLNLDALRIDSTAVKTSYIIGDQIKVRLIQDKDTKHQFIFKGVLINDIERRRI